MKHGDMHYDKDYKKGDMSYDKDYGHGKGNGGHPPVAEAGFKCKGKMPLTGKFWTKDPKHGLA